MLAVQQVTDNALQSQTIVLPDGTGIALQMRYVPVQYGWFITSLVYGTFTIQGLRVVAGPNMLNQYQNQIPFGLACFVAGGREPTQQQDFSTGVARLYILTAAEVQQYTAFLAGGAFPA